LQDLEWCITKSNLPHVDLFLSPRLKKIHIYPSLSQYLFGVPRDIISAIAPTISALPTSALQSLRFSSSGSRYDFTDILSSLVLRCGPSLTEFTSVVPLSGAAVNHLIQLPYLDACHVEGPPPSYSASHSPLVFPSLTWLAVGEGSARRWLLALERLEGHAAPLSKVKESLKSFNLLCPNIDAPRMGSLGSLSLPSSNADAPLASPIQIFHNLAEIIIERFCERQCIFKLNDDNVTELALALPQLESLSLGHPCSRNTCSTIVACLL